MISIKYTNNNIIHEGCSYQYSDAAHHAVKPADQAAVHHPVRDADQDAVHRAVCLQTTTMSITLTRMQTNPLFTALPKTPTKTSADRTVQDTDQTAGLDAVYNALQNSGKGTDNRTVIGDPVLEGQIAETRCRYGGNDGILELDRKR